MGKFALGKTRWIGECHRGLEERNEDQAISLRAMGNPGRVQQGGNQTRRTFLKGHSAIWCGGTRGKRRGPGQRAAASGRMGPAPGLSSLPLGPPSHQALQRRSVENRSQQNGLCAAGLGLVW